MTEPTGRNARKRSQCQRLLDILNDGRWHTAAELLEAVPSVVHSRIAELRKKGFAIEHETRGPGAVGSVYRLADQAHLFNLKEVA